MGSAEAPDARFDRRGLERRQDMCGRRGRRDL